jgi:hypothetical protein
MPGADLTGGDAKPAAAGEEALVDKIDDIPVFGKAQSPVLTPLSAVRFFAQSRLSWRRCNRLS